MKNLSAQEDECRDARDRAEPVRERQWGYLGKSQLKRSERLEQQFHEAEREKQVRRCRRNALIAVRMAIEIEERPEDPNRDGQCRTSAILHARHRGQNSQTDERRDRETPDYDAESVPRREQ